MISNTRGKFSASSSLLGYLYQVRYALLESLRRLPTGQDFSVSIETLDDVVFAPEGNALELLQTKHHIDRFADLSDSSSDLWKSLRIWIEALNTGSLPEDSLLFLITTGSISEQYAVHYLKPGSERNPERALQRFNSISQSTSNQTNVAAYQVYTSLSSEKKKKLLDNIFIIEAAPNILALDEELKQLIYIAVKQKFINSFLQRLEGWWYQRVINHLSHKVVTPILSTELDSEIALLREQFKEDNLPIDKDIMSASIDATGYENYIFVHQLQLIGIGNERIYYAIKNYFRAFEHMSCWIREDLILVGDLEYYEDRLVEEWNIHFQQMREELGEIATEHEKKIAAQKLYKWIETGNHLLIRSSVTEPAISRGTYQLLSDAQRVGWHLEFKELLRKLLEPREVSL
ncbi:MAG: ABC-three component system protein [bacterium]